MRSVLVVAVVVAACGAPMRTTDMGRSVFHNDRAPEVTKTEAAVLFPAATACADIPCMIDLAYKADVKARALAHSLYRTTGSVAGVGPEEIMDGGYRGKIKLVPQLPTGRYRQHLDWVHQSFSDIDGFFRALFPATVKAPAYRWRALQLRFLRSVGKRTPSAYAMGWIVAYNVEGSLLTSLPGVRETLFHELFHSNDFARGDWSARTLQKDYDAIVAKCGTKKACLAPFAPNTTMVRGGTYYAFQPNNGNGVHEYAAELAVRYWKEHTEILAKGKLAKPAFKCGPAENARSWQALVDEFFGGRDLVPRC